MLMNKVNGDLSAAMTKIYTIGKREGYEKKRGRKNKKGKKGKIKIKQ